MIINEICNIKIYRNTCGQVLLQNFEQSIQSCRIQTVVGIHHFIIKAICQLQTFIYTGTMSSVFLMNSPDDRGISALVFFCDGACLV